MFKKILKVNINSLFEILKEHGNVYGPMQMEGSSFEYKNIKTIDEVNLDHTRTMIPPKKFFLQPKETLYVFDEKKDTYSLKAEKKPQTGLGKR